MYQIIGSNIDSYVDKEIIFRTHTKLVALIVFMWLYFGPRKYVDLVMAKEKTQ